MNTSSVQCFYADDGTPLGMALMQVSNEDDAERLRRGYSGNTIDGSEYLMRGMYGHHLSHLFGIGPRS